MSCLPTQQDRQTITTRDAEQFTTTHKKRYSLLNGLCDSLTNVIET